MSQVRSSNPKRLGTRGACCIGGAYGFVLQRP
jgi:hypothetical protein